MKLNIVIGVFCLSVSGMAAEKLDYRKDGTNYILVLKPGQKVVAALVEFAEREKLPGANFNAIGAIKNAELSYYNLKTKAYQSKKFAESHEVVALTGSIAYFEKRAVVHAHAVLSGADFQTVGGHLQEAEVALVLEFFVQPTQTSLVRKASQDFRSLRTLDLNASL